MSSDSLKLLGRWRTDPSDSEGREGYGNVTLIFEPAGLLTYVIHEQKRDEVIRMTYRIEGDFLVTDQPSAPAEEKTLFAFDELGRLVLTFEGTVSRYIRSA